MDATPEVIARLRRKTAERIPDPVADPDGSTTTNFSDDELTDILGESDTIEWAAYKVWIEKAGLYLEGEGIIIEASIGSEKLKMATPIDRHKYARTMADFYYGLTPAEEPETSQVWEQTADPDPLAPEAAAYEDFSRLMVTP